MRLPHTSFPVTRTVAMETRRAPTSRSIDVQIRAQLGSAGRCPDAAEESVHVLIYDDSGSVVGFGGNDCVGRRYAETAIAVDRLAATCRCRRELVGIVHFDPGFGDAKPVVVGTRDGLAVVRGALRIPPGAPGVSTAGSALAVAERLAVTRPLTTVVILSDFELTDPARVAVLVTMRPSWVEHVHLVNLGRAPFIAAEQTPSWVTVTNLNAQTRRPGDVAKAMFASFIRTRRSLRRPR